VLELGQDAEEGKIFLEKMILGPSVHLKTGHECPLMVFFAGKQEELDKSSQSSTVDGILYEEASLQT